jgi:hypothetical protein
MIECFARTHPGAGVEQLFAERDAPPRRRDAVSGGVGRHG